MGNFEEMGRGAGEGSEILGDGVLEVVFLGNEWLWKPWFQRRSPRASTLLTWAALASWRYCLVQTSRCWEFVPHQPFRNPSRTGMSGAKCFSFYKCWFSN